jgi:hypothetical protein
MYGVDSITKNELDIIEYAKVYGNRMALNEFKSFHEKDRNRNRKLKQLITRQKSSVLPTQSIIKYASTHTNKETLTMFKNFHYKDKNRDRKLKILLCKHSIGCVIDQSKLCERQSGLIYKSPFMNKNQDKKRKYCRPTWEEIKKFPVEFTTKEIKRQWSDLSPILRRRKEDALPCVLPKFLKASVHQFHDEDSWDKVLPGGAYEASKLSLEDKLIFPAYIRGVLMFFISVYRLCGSLLIILQVSVLSFKNCGISRLQTHIPFHFL